MTENERIFRNLLRTFDYAMLKRTGPKTYEFFGEAPEFYLTLFPQADAPPRQPSTTPWDSSAMLDFFIEEAETFFESGNTGEISTGMWEEGGLPLPKTALIANAVAFPDAQLIIIRLLKEDYAERVRLLQRAREQLLENRELSQHLAMFKEKSRIDGLTSIFNRATFSELLQDEIKRSHILEYPLALLILDIDDFKKVNDTFGHLVGDAVLRGVGSVLKNTLRRNDIVARYGGEEFAVLIPHELLEQTEQVAEKIRSNIAEMLLPETPQITVSIGCTAYIAGESAEDFFRRADEALYTAKREGKNRVCIA